MFRESASKLKKVDRAFGAVGLIPGCASVSCGRDRTWKARLPTISKLPCRGDIYL
jgi:hypothetical protein